jgi:hypothetical protein
MRDPLESRDRGRHPNLPKEANIATILGSLSHRGIESGVNDSGGTKTEAAPREAASTIAC